MNRLTKRHNNGASWNGNPDHSTQVRYRELLDRLAAYEDTGLTPEETEDIAKAKADGRCVVLPCKPNERWIGEQGEIVVIKIVTDWTGTYVHYRYKGKREVCCCNPTYFAIHFTREEAEAALRKEQGDER
jgi:hypothetical protein